MSNLRFPEINQVALSGHLCQDPESRLMESGKLRVTFNIATNLRYRDKNDNWKQDTTFVPVSVWDKLAEYSEGSTKAVPCSSQAGLGRLRDKQRQPHCPGGCCQAYPVPGQETGNRATAPGGCSLLAKSLYIIIYSLMG